MKRSPLLAVLITSVLSSAAFAATPTPAVPWPPVTPTHAKPVAPERAKTRLICKTGSEARAPGQPLKLFFQYNIPMQFEPEDPTQPFDRQVVTFAGRPRVQLSFDKSPAAAGDRGENLAPMQCALAKRPLSAREPAKVQILIPPGELVWLSQAIGQKPTESERPFLVPGSDWSFAAEHDKVFAIDLDDAQDFITSQKPRLLAPGA